MNVVSVQYNSVASKFKLFPSSLLTPTWCALTTLDLSAAFFGTLLVLCNSAEGAPRPLSLRGEASNR